MRPKIYVGTYAKYNGGSIQGAWLDAEDYSSKDEFLEACRELHKDEADPELMFQDYEEFPAMYYSESDIDADLWDEFLLADADEREAFSLYIDNIGNGATYEGFKDAYQGEFDSEVDFAYYIVEETGLLDGKDEILSRYFDYEAYARDLFIDGYSFIKGHVFCDY